MTGIGVATAALVVVMSVFNGFHQLIEERLSVFDPPLMAIAVEGKTIEQADSLCALLAARPEIERALPVVSERALAISGERQAAVHLYGIPEALYSVFDSLSLAGEPWREYYPGVASAVVSVGVANELQATVGSEQLLGLYVPRRVGRINPANPMGAFRTDSVAVSSAFALNQPEYDRDALFAPIDLVRNLLQYSTEATRIHIFPASDASVALSAARELLGPRVKILTRAEQQQDSFRIVNMEKWMTFLLLGFILIIASFNIISSLSLMIIEKRENDQTLAALGLNSRGRRSVYIWCGLIITAAGGFCGMIFGSLLSLGQQHFGWVKLAGDPSQLSVSAYPVLFQPADLLPIALLIALIGLLTALITTRR